MDLELLCGVFSDGDCHESLAENAVQLSEYCAMRGLEKGSHSRKYSGKCGAGFLKGCSAVSSHWCSRSESFKSSSKSYTFLFKEDDMSGVKMHEDGWVINYDGL